MKWVQGCKMTLMACAWVCCSVFVHLCLSPTRFSLSSVWENSRQGRIRGDSARQRSSVEQQAERWLLFTFRHWAAAAAVPSVPRKITCCETLFTAPPQPSCCDRRYTLILFLECMKRVSCTFLNQSYNTVITLWVFPSDRQLLAST